MNFEYSSDQNAIRQSLSDFLKNEWPKDRTREMISHEIGYDNKVWRKLVKLGFTGVLIPEKYGGMGGDFLELSLLMEEVGRNVFPSPFFSTVCQCAPAIMHFGNESQKKKVLSEIAGAGEVWSLALNDAIADYEGADIHLSAQKDDDQYILNGIKHLVPYANSAKGFLVVARTDAMLSPEEGITVFLVDADKEGISITDTPIVAPGVKCEVHFDNVAVSENDVLGRRNEGRPIVEYVTRCGAVLKSAEMLGGMKAALDLAVRYAKERVQFDRPIATFQVIQHRLVEMLRSVNSLKNLVYEAAWHMSTGKPSRLLSSSVKVKANETYHRVCFDAVAIHGAIGWTREMDVSLYLLRSKELENDCGNLDFHKERIAEELSLKDLDFLMLKKTGLPVYA